MKKSGILNKVSPLARRMVLYIVLGSTFITIFTSLFQLYQIYKVDISGIEVRMNEVRDSYSKNIATRLWVYNKKELDEALKSVLRLPALEYIEIYEGDELVAQQGTMPNTDIIEKNIPLFYTFRNEKNKIGRIQLIASLDDTYHHLYEQAFTIIISNAIKTFFISGFMLFLFYRLLARHLILLSDFAETISVNSFNNKLKLKKKSIPKQPDEIDLLANTLINLQERIKETISELNEKQINLENSEAKFRGILESAVDGILMVDHNGVITLVNKSLCDLTGYSNDELIGETIEKIVPVKFSNHRKLRENYLKNPSSRNMGIGNTFEAQRKDGTLFHVEVSLAPVETANGTIVTAMMQDVTARLNTENERETLLKNLEYKNEELERFTYTVSHDLKSPLVTITGFIGLLKKDIADENKKRIESDFIRISDAANTMQKLLDDLLDLSRVGRQMNSFEEVSVKNLLDSVLKMLEGKIINNNVKITIEPNLPVINVEETRFKEVFLNLIENAIKYKKENTDVEIKIGFEKSELNSDEIIFYVKDNGLGIEPQYHKKIFDLFERLSNEKEGTGVGLAIVKRIIDVHQGKIWVESNGVGHGSTFKFIIPKILKQKDGDYNE